MAPDVQFLRGFRDLSVEATFAGNAFMQVFNAFYYSFSTTVASKIAQYPILQDTVKNLLYPLVASLRTASAAFTAFGFVPELAVIASGLIASALLGTAYLAPVISLALVLSKRLRKR